MRGVELFGIIAPTLHRGALVTFEGVYNWLKNNQLPTIQFAGVTPFAGMTTKPNLLTVRPAC